MTVSGDDSTQVVEPSLDGLGRVASASMEPSPRDRVSGASADTPDSAKPRPSDAKLRAQTDMILALPVTERLRQLEAEAAFFSSLRPLDD